jgi:PAS domain-containing protein
MHLDISQERRTQQHLRASELRFRQMAENIGDVFYLRDAQNGDILYVSPAYETIWGTQLREPVRGPGIVGPFDPPGRPAGGHRAPEKGKYAAGVRSRVSNRAPRWFDSLDPGTRLPGTR